MAGGWLGGGDTASTDVALLIAGGIEFGVQTRTVYVELMYALGLTDVLDPAGEIGFDAEVRNRTSSLVVGVRL